MYLFRFLGYLILKNISSLKFLDVVIMDNESPWSPLAVMLSMYGSKISSKLLFKYPFQACKYIHPSLPAYTQLTSSMYHLNQLSFTSNKGNEYNNENECDDDLERDQTLQYLSFSDDILAQISCPGNSTICGQKFDVKINGLRFVGFPLMLEHNNVESDILEMDSFLSQSEQPETSNSSATDIFVMSFNVVFVLKTTANYSIVESYQQLASKLGIGLRYEEKRDGYMTRQTKSMLNIHDEDTDLSQEQIFRKILEKSSLAKNFCRLFESLEDTGIIQIQLNNNLSISFCLYHKIHNVCFENCKYMNIAAIERCLKKIQPLHGVLVYDIKNVWNSLTESRSGSIVSFLKVYKPTSSLQTLAIDSDIALNHIYTIARHLVMWGKACIIYPLCETNVYVLAPTATLQFQSKFVKMFADRFKLNLTEILSYFSTPTSLGDYQSPNGPFFDNQNTLVEILIWMLQHRFLVQLHTYVYFISLADITDESKNELSCLIDTCDSTTCYFERLPIAYQNILRYVNAARSPEDLYLFLRLLKYFNGVYHLEEIMYRENMVRFELVTVLDKFKPVLSTTVREDEIASAFCMPK